MHDLLPFIVIGLVSGSLYGLIGTGLVLTFKTSGLFNFGHGALATVAAYVFYELYVEQGTGWLPAGFIGVIVVGILMGFGLERFSSTLTQATTSMKIVATIGIILFVQGTITALNSEPQSVPQYLPTESFEVFGIFVGWEQAIVIIVSVVLITALYLHFRFTRLGAAMRAVVDSPALLAAQGTDPRTVRRFAWVVGAGFACLSGVLLVPTTGLNPTILTLLVVPGFGAAAIGGFSSLPLTYVGGLAIGIAEAMCLKYITGTGFWSGLAPSIPFLVLVVVLVALPSRRLIDRREPRQADVRRWQAPARVQIGLVVVVGAVVLLVPTFAGSQLLLYTGALSTVVVLLSLGLLVRTSGQVSLTHAGFMAVAAAAFAQLSHQVDLPWPVALFGAALLAGAVGAVVALPAIRVSGVYLALATFGFGILLERMLYQSPIMFDRFVQGKTADRPVSGAVDISNGNGYYYLTLFIVTIICIVVVLIHRARLGRLLRGLAGSPTALSTLGTNTTVLRLIVFVLSAFLAGLAGALYASTTTQTTGASFSSFQSLVFFTVVVLVVGHAPWFAVFGALTAAIIPTLIHIDNAVDIFNALFGFFAFLVAVRSTREELPAVLAMRRFFDRIGGRVAPPVALELAEREAMPPPAPAIAAGKGLEVTDLTVRYGGTLAVDDLALAAPLGRITGLIGPNGAGKSTTFNACSGLVRPTRGTIRFKDEDISSLSPAGRAQRGIGRTFQRMELFDHLTAEENVRLGAEARQAGSHPVWQVVAPPSDIRAVTTAAEQAAELVGVTGYWRRTAGELTTGQRRLVELARCLAGSPELLLLDEPSSGLDSDETQHFGEVLRVVVRERGSGILLVEHDMSLVMETCAYIYVLDFGRLMFEGTPTEVSSSEVVRQAYLGSEDLAVVETNEGRA